MRKTLPGFLLTIEDNAPAVEAMAVQKDIYMIYAVLPEKMKYIDDEGVEYDKYIEPNTQIIMSSDREGALKTLETSNLELTRETRNMIALLPNGAEISLCRIVKRNGESPEVGNISEMYEALDYAFEETENLPIKEVYISGISLDDAVSLGANILSVTTTREQGVAEQNLAESVKKLVSHNGTDLTAIKTADLSVAVVKDLGEIRRVEFRVDGTIAKAIVGETVEELAFDIVEGNLVGANAVNAVCSVDAEGSLTFNVSEEVRIVLDEEAIMVVENFTIITEKLFEEDCEVIVHVLKTGTETDVLKRMLEHVKTITTTQNNCLLFMSPKGPKNQSKKAFKEYVERCISLSEKIRNKTLVTINGKKSDLGMYLSVPVGVNKLNGVGGLYGSGQSNVATVSDRKIITKNPTSAFNVGDLVEVYTYDKMDILSVSSVVEAVKVSDLNTTEITIRVDVPANVLSSGNPIYIMNVNDKDFNGNYLAIQYSNICSQVGVTRSPAGVVFPGECQSNFSAKQIDLLDGAKFCVLTQNVGTTQGAVSKSQLMSGIQSQFQDYENVATVYNLASGCKTIGMRYKGERLKESTDIALIKNEMETSVFNPAVNSFIYPGYELKLITKNLTNPNGKKEKALLIEFAVTEIQTMKLLRIVARVN